MYEKKTYKQFKRELYPRNKKSAEKEWRWPEDKMFLQVITPREIPANGTLSELLSLKINKLARGDIYLTGVTVLFDLNGERIQLKTPPLKISVDIWFQQTGLTVAVDRLVKSVSDLKTK